MNKKFSKSWKASKQPRKQRKYLANAPLHIKRKILTMNLSKELRKKVGKRNLIVRKGDVVKVMRGDFAGKTGKVLEIFTKLGKVILEGIQVKKRDGSKASVKLQVSNLQIIQMTDRRKMEKAKTENKEVKKPTKSEVKIEEHKK